MKAFILLGLLISSLAWADYVPGGNPCMESAGTLLSASGVTSGNSITQIIPSATGAQIFICSMNVQGVSGTNPTFSLVYGSGSNCATGTTAITPFFSTAAGTLYPFTGPISRVPASKALCYSDGGTTPVQNFILSYIQK